MYGGIYKERERERDIICRCICMYIWFRNWGYLCGTTKSIAFWGRIGMQLFVETARCPKRKACLGNHIGSMGYVQRKVKDCTLGWPPKTL